VIFLLSLYVVLELVLFLHNFTTQASQLGRECGLEHREHQRFISRLPFEHGTLVKEFKSGVKMMFWNKIWIRSGIKS